MIIIQVQYQGGHHDDKVKGGHCENTSQETIFTQVSHKSVFHRYVVSVDYDIVLLVIELL